MTTVELKAFIDESGTHGAGLTTVMAGWLGYADRWVDFDRQWRSRCLRDGLPYIHAIDLKHGRRVFKDKIKWPFPRRLTLAKELGELTEQATICSLSVILKKSDYDAVYIGGDKKLRKHRDAVESKYGICARCFLSILAELAERYGGSDAQVTAIFEAGAKGQNVVQTILADMYDVAPDRACFINPTIGFALKEQSPGVQAADCLAYPVYVQESAGIADVSNLEEGWPDTLSAPGSPPTHLRAAIGSQGLRDIREGQIAMGGLRRRLGRYWSRLDGFPKGWTAQPLELGGFVLMPPRPAPPSQQADVLSPGTDEPIGFVRLECE
jgi:hypothetical protein